MAAQHRRKNRGANPIGVLCSVPARSRQPSETAGGKLYTPVEMFVLPSLLDGGDTVEAGLFRKAAHFGEGTQSFIV